MICGAAGFDRVCGHSLKQRDHAPFGLHESGVVPFGDNNVITQKLCNVGDAGSTLEKMGAE